MTEATNLSHLIGFHLSSLTLDIFSDIVVATTYFIVPVILIYLVRKHKNKSYRAPLLMFSALLACLGINHVIGVFSPWYQDVDTYSIIKAISALITILAVTTLWVILPKFVRLPDVQFLREANIQLQNEIFEKDRAQAELARRTFEMVENEQVRAKEAIRRTEESFRILVNGVKEYAIFMLDFHGNVVSWNDGAERTTGYVQSEIIGEHFSIFYPNERRSLEIVSQSLYRAANGHHSEEDIMLIKKDGSPFWATSSLTPIQDDLGNLQSFLFVIRDISDRKRAELLLMAQSEQIRTVVENIADAVVTIDENGIIQSWNSAAQSIFGYTAGEALGKSAKLLLPEPYYDREELDAKEWIRLWSAGSVKLPDECIGRRKDGSHFPLDIALSESKTYGQKFYTGIIRDITERKRVQADLQAAKDAAEAANHAKGAFLANMSHEIRTPLGAVVGFSTLLSNPNCTEAERVVYKKVIRRNAELLTTVIDDILDIAKVEAQKLTVSIEDVSIGELMSDVSTVLGLRAREKGIHFSMSASGPVPDLVRTDPIRLRQILLNLVGNAIKFTEKGSVRVSYEYVSNTDGKPRVVFVVSDTGVGLSKDSQAHLFEPFFQADNSSTRRTGGTGLGLILSRRLANLLGGDVNLTFSQPGVGSTFTITITPELPLSTVAVEVAKENLKAASPSMIGLRELARLDQRHLLLAEDSPDNQLLFTTYLRSVGAKVDVANDGQEALERLKEEQYDLVLMDLQMPGMDGFEATRELRQRGLKIPVIALSAHALIEIQQQCSEAGFDGHISKPVDRETLVNRVADYISGVQLHA